MSIPRVRHLALALTFAALLGAAACSKSGAAKSGTAATAGGGTASGDFFVDEAAARGVDFRFVSGRTGKRWMPEQLGGGGALFDADGDGDLDLFLTNGGPLPGSDDPGPNALYLNDGAGRFTPVPDAGGLAGGRDYGVGCAVADVDLDGDIDVFVTNWGPDRLYLNDGHAHFTDVSAANGIVADADWGASAVFGDFTGDGLPDLYVTNYLAYDIANHKPCHQQVHEIYCGPQPYDGVPDRYYVNLGGGRFADRTAGKGLAAGVLDYDRDGDLDIYVANDQTPNFLWQNDGTGKFTNVAFIAGIASSKDGAMQAGMGVAWSDFDGDGLEDIIVTNFEDQVNSVYRNDGDGFYSECSYQVGIGYESRPYLGWGLALEDFTNDGLRDLVVSNGHIYDNAELLNDRSSWAQRMRFHKNLGGAKFASAEGAGGAAFDRKTVGRGLIWGDIDDDGRLDLVHANLEDKVQVLMNHGAAGHWLKVAVVDEKAKTPIIGARVTIRAGTFMSASSVQPGSSYLASNDPRVHFGLGEKTAIDSIEVAWPGKTTRVFGPVDADRMVLVSREGDASVVDLKSHRVVGTLKGR